MPARFATNFVVLLLGASLVTVGFAFSATTVDWFGVGVGAGAILAALTSFAVRNQGVYQRIADVIICLTGAWVIVAARVMNPGDRWLEFSGAMALAVLGAIGLVVRETRLNRGVQVGDARIGPDELAHMSTLQRDAGAWR